MNSMKFESTEDRKSHFQNDLLEIFDKKGPPDLRLCVANTYVCLDAHKQILAGRSAVFASMIFKQQLDGLDIIKVEGVTLRVLTLIICYMYNDELKTDSPKELMEVGKAAQKFEISGLIRSCKHKLIHCSIDRYNVWSLIEASKFFKLETFGERGLRFLKSLSTKSLFGMPEFLEANQDTVFYILKRRDIFMESDAFWMEGIIRWLQHHKSRDRFLLSAIKPFSIDCSEFLDLIEKYPIFFTSKEISRVLCNMLRPGMLEVPSWCEAVLKKNNVKPFSNYNDIATNALKIKLEYNRRFPKSFFCEEDEFEGSVVFEIKLTKHFPRMPYLVMLELAFGTTYVPRENLDLELYHYEQSTVLVKKKIDFLLKATENHYYLMVNQRIYLHKNSPFVFALKLRASGLMKWGNDGPISNRQYRVAKIPEDIFQNICLDIDGYKSICLTFLSDWMVFIDPKYDKKNLVLTSFYFDSYIKSEELSSES
ncbi:uncharacterized protein LOC129985307 [Argiope bruennichi]|uniref:uncharacterized protein LOC129985307 n=1 Tax=Argiope bruennichi TaxID=94029 RepID=UPI0024951682|nr:uncharacterized protein LOC129985307 [Argiope bruennichi]XP_055951263.1 uncharacterized protein LOC129985307 [Argiope bruennichi]